MWLSSGQWIDTCVRRIAVAVSYSTSRSPTAAALERCSASSACDERFFALQRLLHRAKRCSPKSVAWCSAILKAFDLFSLSSLLFASSQISCILPRVNCYRCLIEGKS